MHHGAARPSLHPCGVDFPREGHLDPLCPKVGETSTQHSLQSILALQEQTPENLL
jgi:hypothetical protein